MKRMAGALMGLGVWTLAMAGELDSNTIPSRNLSLAQAIAAQIRSNGLLRGYSITVTVDNGQAILEGTVPDEAQRSEAVRMAQSVPGVELVINRLHTERDTQVAPAQLVSQFETAPAPRRSEAPATPLEPIPSFLAGPRAGLGQLPPPLPPYAWPAYAPYNNYSQVSYPTCYPSCAFPYIGPIYPFPRAPLGWRSVHLEFDDGHWWLRPASQRRDWWYLRYW